MTALARSWLPFLKNKARGEASGSRPEATKEVEMSKEKTEAEIIAENEAENKKLRAAKARDIVGAPSKPAKKN